MIGSEKAAAQSCQQYYDQAYQAARRSPIDVNALDVLRTQVGNSAQCDEVQKTCFAYLVADAYARRAGETQTGGGRTNEAEALAIRAAATGRTWRVLWTLASLAQNRKDYDKAAGFYKAALTELADVEKRIETYERTKKSYICPGEKEDLPTPAQAVELMRLSSQADALSKAFVPAPKTRDGSFGGIFIGQLRGVTVNKYPLPVEFKFDSTELTEKGKDAVRFISDYVKQTSPEKVVLTGHADRKGSDDYNCQLSKRRLDALIGQLQREASRNVTFVGIPQGKGDPFPIVEGSDFTQDEIDQINRRVELRDRPDEIVRKCP